MSVFAQIFTNIFTTKKPPENEQRYSGGTSAYTAVWKNGDIQRINEQTYEQTKTSLALP